MRRKGPGAIKDAFGAAGDPAPLWRERLLLNDKGAPRACLANAIIAFRGAPEWQAVLAFDEFASRAVLRGRAPWMVADGTGEAWSDVHDVRAADWLQRQGIGVSAEIAGQAVEVVARDRVFHPVRDYLDGLSWDSIPRLDEWAIKYLGAVDTDYVRAVGSRWLISAVARVRRPGCKMDCVPVLEGEQGIRKSSALRCLAEPWFTDDLADLGSKDAALQLAGVWLIEIAELGSIQRAELAKVKAFITRGTDRFRPPYGRRLVEAPRQCVFAATTNTGEYLKDETGNRRFWPIAVKRVDLDGLIASRDHLWAEANARFLADEAWWLDTPDLDRAAAEEQRQRYSADPWQDAIQDHLQGRAETSVSSILELVFNRRPAEQSVTDANRVGRCLKSMGWRRIQRREGGRRWWIYVSPLSPVGPDDR